MLVSTSQEAGMAPPCSERTREIARDESELTSTCRTERTTLSPGSGGRTPLNFLRMNG